MAGKYNLPEIYRGDTFEAEQFQIVIDGTPLDLTGATIETVFARGKKGGTEIYQTPGDMFIFTMHRETGGSANVGVTYEFCEEI